MSAMNTSSSNASTTDAYEDDLLTWLQYPTDDAFERSYCSDVFQGAWPPPSTATTEAANKTNTDAVPDEHKGTSISIMGTGTCETRSVPCNPLLATKHMRTKPALISKSSCNVNAEEALAQGAARAAGHSLQVGQDAYNKVKTLMQPTHENYHPSSSTPCHVPNACIKGSKDHPIKPNFPVFSIPACAPNCKAPQNAANTRLDMLDYPPLRKTKHATFESMTSSKRVRTEYEAHSHTNQIEPSRITEESSIERGKIMMGADRRSCTLTSTSCSGASHSSMSLSGRETACFGGKRKQEEFQEYAEDDTKKGSKPLSKRNRVAQVHNLSEKNRRNRINEKLKALQDLIPNSSKTDKASILDEAIEYMKTLQMQLQMVSMRNSLNAPTMMMNLPQTHMQTAQPHLIGLGVPIGHAAGLGMGLGVGMPEMGPPTAPTLLQCPAAMRQLHTMPVHSANMASFAHMGFLQSTQISPTMQNLQESYELLEQRAAYIHQHEQHEQGGPSISKPRA